MKSSPVRRCTGCLKEFPQTGLIRVVKTAKGKITINAPGSTKTPGRGAYICATADCLKKATKKRRKKSSLVFWLGQEIPDEILAELESYCA